MLVILACVAIDEPEPHVGRRAVRVVVEASVRAPFRALLGPERWMQHAVAGRPRVGTRRRPMPRVVIPAPPGRVLVRALVLPRVLVRAASPHVLARVLVAAPLGRVLVRAASPHVLVAAPLAARRARVRPVVVQPPAGRRRSAVVVRVPASRPRSGGAPPEARRGSRSP